MAIKVKKKSLSLLSVIIITKNEEQKLPDCLESIKWANEIILVDSGSTDKTVAIAKQYNAKVVKYKEGSFSDWRNAGLKAAKNTWIFYIDADERMTNELREELIHIMNANTAVAAYAVPRKNIILGKEMRYAGQWPDYQMRFFKKVSLKGYHNDLHELADFEGEQEYLKNPIIHLKHNNLSDMVSKTNKWSELEAKLLYESGHPKMVWWRFIRIIMTELWTRLIGQGGVLDGAEGIIYAIYQSWSRFITYGKLWEMQLNHEKMVYKK